jgi:hypothetical protein
MLFIYMPFTIRVGERAGKGGFLFMRRRVQQILCGALIAGTVLASQPLPVFAETDTETGSDVSETDVKEKSDYVIYVNKDNPDTASIVEYT